MAMADVTFNVVGLRENDADEFGVMIDGKLTKLETTKDTYPLWSVDVADVDGPLEYKYVQLVKGGEVGKQEKTTRKLPEGALHTPNEFFDRSQSVYDLPPLPQVYENELQQSSPFFREGYIGNIFVEGNAAKIKHINKGGEDFYPDPVHVNVQYIGANDNIKINNCTFNLSGASAREFAKLAYKIKFPKKNRLLDLASLKLRNAETDATMMREKIYVDILNSIGVPTSQATYVRLFVNNKPIGMFVAMEEMKKHWIKKVLHPNVHKTKPGALWKMNSCCGFEGNLEWLGPTTKSYVLGDIYKNILPGNNPKDNLMKDLIQFMADLKNFDPKKTKDPIAYWEQRLDLDGFLKSMAMEYLTGSWDSYWNSGSNYQLYNDPVTGKWTWFPMDFDDTFGTAYSGPIASYRQIPKKNAEGFESPLAQKLIMETPEINARFEAILKDIVSYVFNPNALTPRMDAYKEMIQEDVAWDRALPRVSNGIKTNFTAADLVKGLDVGIKSGWGLKKWIVKRAAQVSKDMNFKIPTGNADKTELHIMTKLESAYGITPKRKVSPETSDTTVTKSDSNSNSNNSNSNSNNSNDNNSNNNVANSANTGAKQDTKSGASNDHQDAATSSAEKIKSKWAVFAAFAMLVVVAL
ncbi:hypothetical protein BGZ51_006555 [Haplosporangium sp. Z 767]|nr:hypothetical protein BGZ51_006555 [Haplosporangium sp. Z 767]